jgi:hypothetical protein
VSWTRLTAFGTWGRIADMTSQISQSQRNTVELGCPCSAIRVERTIAGEILWRALSDRPTRCVQGDGREVTTRQFQVGLLVACPVRQTLRSIGRQPTARPATIHFQLPWQLQMLPSSPALAGGSEMQSLGVQSAVGRLCQPQRTCYSRDYLY